MFYQLAPVGNPVCLKSQSTGLNPDSLFGCQTQLFASGTAALAAAIVAATRHKSRSAPEVIFPAYGCPDLISAAEFAGVKPVLVDLEADRPWLDLEQLAPAITENTVAIVAVNLFGIAERWAPMRTLAEKNGLILIEDSAQYFPGGDEQMDWQGDMVVLSFGRGKPVGLLGGGAVLTNNASLFQDLPKPDTIEPSLKEGIAYGLKARIYNAMISPRLYWLPQALPFLHLGETRYHALPDITAMQPSHTDLLAVNLAVYRNDAGVDARITRISTMLDTVEATVNLPRACNIRDNRRLLRYPLLVDSAKRDSVCQRLQQAGLGVSVMYPASLPEIAGLAHLLDSRACFANAQKFASSLLTLPTHSHVSEQDIDRMKEILSEHL